MRPGALFFIVSRQGVRVGCVREMVFRSNLDVKP